MCSAESPQVAHSSTMVAVRVFPWYETLTHIPQYAPLPQPGLLLGNAAKYSGLVPTLVTESLDASCPVAQVPVPLAPLVSVP